MQLFISDMHLQEERPGITRVFLQFLENQAPQAEALYLLGDIFNYWVGDDAMTPFHHQMAAALHKLSCTGTKVFIMHGNRDFAIGQEFCRLAGCTLLPDPSVVTLYDHKYVLMHGDSLCTDQKAYQILRYLLRQPVINYCLHRLPLSWRKKIGVHARSSSQKRKQRPQPQNYVIADVNSKAVVKQLHKHQCALMIHGHTHRPAVHEHQIQLQGQVQTALRYVLGDWNDTSGWKLEVTAAGAKLIEFH